MSNPLAQFASFHESANAHRIKVVGELQKQIDNAELLFSLQMRAAVQDAHTAGVTRYMAQKVTGAPAAQVNEWFGNLPTSTPGRRRKDDPIYYTNIGGN
jgi:hypothetical protein